MLPASYAKREAQLIVDVRRRYAGEERRGFSLCRSARTDLAAALIGERVVRCQEEPGKKGENGIRRKSRARKQKGALVPIPEKRLKLQV